MKKSMILVMAAAAAALALVSCTKETTDSNESGNAQDGLRTLTVSFASQSTRTYLDGYQPLWKGNGTEKISLNGDEYTVPVEAAGKASFTLTTTITGDITAVYPASAWTSSEPHFSVSATPDGTFASANICTATAKAGDTELAFKNQTAIIEVSVPSGTKQLTVTSLNPVSSSTGRRATSGAVNIAEGSATITVGDNSANIPNPCYVSVLPGTVLLQDLNFDTGSAQGGFSPKYITSKGKTPSSYAVEVNTMYTLEAASLHDYVTVAGKKWATMNVGASSSTDKGTYFAWGDVIGQNATTNGTGAFSTGFSWDNCPFVSFYYYDEEANGGEGQLTITLTKYYNGAESDDYSVYINCNKDDKTTLDLENDAAFANWGGAWRMPTQTEFNTLVGAKQSWDSSNKGWTFGNPSIFLPAAGFGSGTLLIYAGSLGYYWSSSLVTDLPYNAYNLYFSSSIVSSISSGRCCGFSVRPLSE